MVYLSPSDSIVAEGVVADAKVVHGTTCRNIDVWSSEGHGKKSVYLFKDKTNLQDQPFRNDIELNLRTNDFTKDYNNAQVYYCPNIEDLFLVSVLCINSLSVGWPLFYKI